MATTGEKSFSMSSQEKKKRVFDPIKAGDYDLKLKGDVCEMRTSTNAEPGKPPPVPRISLRFEALNSAAEEGGKNALIFHDLYLKTEPGKDGIITFTTADQLKGLCDALGEQLDGIPTVKYKGISILDPRVVLKWVKAHDGEIVRAHIALQKGTTKYPGDKNRLTEFLDREGGGEEGAAEEEAPLEEELPAEEGGEELLPEEETADPELDELPPLEEEPPAPPPRKAVAKVAAKPAAKVAARPAAKPVAKKR